MPRDSEKPYNYATESEVTLKPSLSDQDGLRSLDEKSKSKCRATEEDAASSIAPTCTPAQPTMLSAFLRMVLLHSEADALEEARAAQEEKKRSAAIDEYLEAEGSKLRRDLKILVLGSWELDMLLLRQARLLKDPLTDKEREESVPSARRNVLEHAKQCLWHVIEKVPDGDDSQESTTAVKAVAEKLKNMLEQYERGEDAGTARAILDFLQDSQLESHLGRCGIDFGEIDSQTAEFGRWSFRNCFCNEGYTILKRLQRVLSPDYVPTDHDWYHFSKRLCGLYVNEVKFDRGSHNLWFLQLGRVCGERRKWFHVVENPAVVTTVLDLACYDEVLCEDESVSSVQEFFVYFDSICHSRWFSDAPMLVVLINAPRFRSKMVADAARFAKVFPKFEGDGADAALEFVKGRIMEIAEGRKRGVWPYVSEIADREAFSEMLDFIDETVLPESNRGRIV